MMALAGRLREMPPEQRGGRRTRLRLRKHGRTAGGVSVDILVHDLSAQGVRLETDHSLRIGERVAISLVGLEPHVARIVWIGRPYAGCAFETPLSADEIRAAWRESPVIWGDFTSSDSAAGDRKPIHLELSAEDLPARIAHVANEGVAQERGDGRLPLRTRFLAIMTINLLLWLPLIALLIWLL